MKRQRLLTVCLILFSVALSNPAYSWHSSAKQAMGKIKGLVLDHNDARVVDASIIIESNQEGGFRKQIKSGEEGDFEIKFGRYTALELYF